MGKVYPMIAGTDHCYYLNGLGMIRPGKSRLAFRDGTDVIERADLAIERRGRARYVEVDDAVFMEVYSAGHALAFLDMGMDPVTHEPFPAGSQEMLAARQKAQIKFNELASKLKERVDEHYQWSVRRQ
jgi:hypothetical protein